MRRLSKNRCIYDLSGSEKRLNMHRHPVGEAAERGLQKRDSRNRGNRRRDLSR